MNSNWLRRYYQWVNLVMFLQAACFYLPRCIYYAFVFLLILAISLFKFVSISSIFSLHTSLFSDYGLFISISKRFLWRRFENGILGHLQQELNNPLQLQVSNNVWIFAQTTRSCTGMDTRESNESRIRTDVFDTYRAGHSGCTVLRTQK